MASGGNLLVHGVTYVLLLLLAILFHVAVLVNDGSLGEAPDMTPSGTVLVSLRTGTCERMTKWLTSTVRTTLLGGMLQIHGATSSIVCIGKEKFGKEMKKNAKLAVVNVHYYEHDNAPTGTCAVYVVGGERSLAANLSVANCYKSDYLKQPENLALAERAKYIYYPAGLFLTESPDFIQLVVEHAAANNKMCTMNLSAPFIYAQEEDLLYMDFVLGNETQARTFSKVHCWETDVVEEIARKIYQWPKASGTWITVITRGPNPVVVAEDGKVKRFPVTKLLEGKLIDTNGAGDAFVGGFLSQLVQEKPIEDCVGACCYASNVIIQGSGCTFNQRKPDFK